MNKEEILNLIDERIKELFENGILQVNLVEKRYKYDDENELEINVSMNGEILYSTTKEVIW